MSTCNALYVRKQGTDDDTRAAILSLYPNARIETLPDFTGAILSRDDLEPPETALADLSAKLGTDVIWIVSQTTAESFIFHRAGLELGASLVIGACCLDFQRWLRFRG